MIQIHKHHISPGGRTLLPLPPGAVFLSAQEQAGRLALWVLLDTTLSVEPTPVIVVGTGIPIPMGFLDGFRYLCTAQIAPYVWHVWVPNA